MTTQTELTEEEHTLIRRSAFGAIALVSNSDRNFLAMFSESMAGSRALNEAPEEIKELLKEGDFPKPPTGSPEEVEAAVLGDLNQAASVLDAKSPQQGQAFREVILAACDRVANAVRGVSEKEAAMLEKVRGAVSGAGPATPPPGS
jgi:hypothetical protein